MCRNSRRTLFGAHATAWASLSWLAPANATEDLRRLPTKAGKRVNPVLPLRALDTEGGTVALKEIIRRR